MRENRQPLSTIAKPEEIKEVTILEFQSFPFEAPLKTPPKNSPNDSLDMSVVE